MHAISNKNEQYKLIEYTAYWIIYKAFILLN
jgi:hypothetical protein